MGKKSLRIVVYQFMEHFRGQHTQLAMQIYTWYAHMHEQHTIHTPPPTLTESVPPILQYWNWKFLKMYMYELKVRQYTTGFVVYSRFLTPLGQFTVKHTILHKVLWSSLYQIPYYTSCSATPPPPPVQKCMNWRLEALHNTLYYMHVALTIMPLAPCSSSPMPSTWPIFTPSPS